MRLGAHPAVLNPDSRAYQCYKDKEISERHRHRFEFNNVYRQQFAAHGMEVAGTSPDDMPVEIIEIPAHPWFVAVQFHPEFKSKPTEAQPLFSGFVEAAIKKKEGRKTQGPHSKPSRVEQNEEQPQ